MTRIIAASVLCMLMTLTAARSAADRPRVMTEAGALAGTTDGAADIYRGIPYAAPPIGPLRWQPPSPAAHWAGERDASDFGPICPQPARPDGVLAAGSGRPQNEDCLTLNVWTPKGASKAPVMVWIHGGAFRFGSGSGPIYDGAKFARDGVLLVTLNYRLGALGFFAHPALTKAAGPNDPLGNYGLMDQLSALRWIQKNIAAFGGDPGNVTVFGESAGGSSILSLLSTPASKGLFAKAIVESGGGWQVHKSLADQEKQGSDLATRLGLSGADATLDQLRAVPVDKLFDLPMTLNGVGPFEDGRLIIETVADAFASGRAQPVPLMIGSNSFEASLMKTFRLPPAILTARMPPALRALYPGSDDDAGYAMFTDAVMGAPAHWIAGQQSARAPTYLYHYAYVPTARRASEPGTPHGGEIPFVFATWSALAGGQDSAEDHAMEERVHACWIAFAKSGRPACSGPDWPAYTKANDTLMEFSTSPTPVANFRSAQYASQEQIGLRRALSGDRTAP